MSKQVYIVENESTYLYSVVVMNEWDAWEVWYRTDNLWQAINYRSYVKEEYGL